MGIKMPKMGTSINQAKPTPRSSLADALFSGTQQRLLGLLFGQPERSFYATELIHLAGVGSGTVQRELVRLAQSGLVTVKPVGNQKHYQANPASPIYEELCGVVRKTVGLAEPLRAALTSFVPQIKAAFVYGSIAKKEDTASSDIDLMVVSDTLTYGDLIVALQDVTELLGREVNPNIFTQQDFSKRLKEGSSFVSRVMVQPKVWLIGGELELAI